MRVIEIVTQWAGNQNRPSSYPLFNVFAWYSTYSYHVMSYNQLLMACWCWHFLWPQMKGNLNLVHFLLIRFKWNVFFSCPSFSPCRALEVAEYDVSNGKPHSNMSFTLELWTWASAAIFWPAIIQRRCWLLFNGNMWEAFVPSPAPSGLKTACSTASRWRLRLHFS